MAKFAIYKLVGQSIGQRRIFTYKLRRRIHATISINDAASDQLGLNNGNIHIRIKGELPDILAKPRLYIYLFGKTRARSLIM